MTLPSETDMVGAKLQYRALVLGPLSLERDGERIEAGRWQPRVQTLFLLLVTAPDRQRRRDDLMDLLWPDAEPDTAAGNLRILVHRLRLTLGGEPSPVLSDHGWIRLNPAYEWTLDLEEMEELVREANGDPSRLQAAAALYRGQPLVEHRYDDWAMPLLEHAQRIWRLACMQLATIQAGRGESGEAAAWYRRVLDVDPLDEEAVRGLLTALGNAGKPGEALRQFERFRETLAAEIGAPPEPKTIALADRLKILLTEGDSAPPADLAAAVLPVAVPDFPLINRQDELERALLTADGVETGAGRVVLLTGEAGVGKTRLAQEVMLRLSERGFLTTAVRCFERDRFVPFSPFLDVLASTYALLPPGLRAEAAHRWPQLAWLLPVSVAPAEGNIPDEPDQQRLLFRACVGVLTRVAAQRPLALWLDDLHWADEGSLDLLRYLATQMRGAPIFILGTYRDADVSREHPLQKAVRDLLRDGLAERVSLARLGPDETAQLVAAGLGGARPPDDFADFAYRRTKGNPFYVRRMVEALGGRYRLLRQIASGGMGRVFEARDTTTGARVAVKIMFARTEADPRALLRFRQEGAILASLSHPNIVRVHTTVVEEHASSIVMDLVEGRSLADVIRDEEMPISRAKHLSQQVAAALESAHERGVVHRDIKPSNIMVGADDHVTVTDFGIARLLRTEQQPSSTTFATTSTGMTLGTPLYMSPEQIQGQRVDARADIYSLGALLYHLVTSEPPFSGSDAVTIAYKHVHESPVHPRARCPDLPQAWEDVILRALAKSPDDRFQSAVAMKQAISALQVPEPEQQRMEEPSGHTSPAALETPVGGAKTLPAPVRSWPAQLLAMSCVLAVLVLAGALLFGKVINGEAGASSHGSGPGQFDGPTSVEVDLGDNVYVADGGNHRLQQLSPKGFPVRQWNEVEGVGLPSDVARDFVGGSLFVSDLQSGTIDRLYQGRKLEAIGMGAGALAVGPDRALYAADYGRKLLCVLHPRVSGASRWNIPKVSFIRTPHSATERCAIPPGNDRVTVSTIPLVLPPSPGTDTRFVNVGSLQWPAGIAVDRHGRLYVCDRRHDQIAVFDAAGKPLRTIGKPGQRPGEFDTPSDVAVDEDGDIFVADTENDRIQQLSPIPPPTKGGKSDLSAGGKPVHRWDLYYSGIGRLHRPVSLAVSPGRGNITVSDFENDRIVRLSFQGQTVWYSHGEQPGTPPAHVSIQADFGNPHGTSGTALSVR